MVTDEAVHQSVDMNDDEDGSTMISHMGDECRSKEVEEGSSGNR